MPAIKDVPASAPEAPQSQLSPAEYKQRMALAQQLMKHGSSNEPIYSNAAAIAKVAESAFGGLMTREAQKEYQNGLKQSAQTQGQFFAPASDSPGGFAPQAAPSSAPDLGSPWAQAAASYGAPGSSPAAGGPPGGPGGPGGPPGGLFNLGGLFNWSDRRLKKDVEKVGALESGLPVYRYRYNWGGPERVGVIAQEAAWTHPDAVSEMHGHLVVDYGKID